MSGFTEPLAYRSTDTFRGGRRQEVVVNGESFVSLTGARRIFMVDAGFFYDCARTGRQFAVQSGFLCDLGTIPAFARGLLSPDDPWAQAYVLHDMLYRTAAVDRKTADLILWDALGLPFRAYDEAGAISRVLCPAAYRAAIYYSIRLAGGPAYDRWSRARLG